MLVVETQLLELFLAERNKGSVGGGACYFSRVFEEDFAGVFTVNVLQQFWRAYGLLGVDFGRSKPGQTISGFLWVLLEKPRNNFTEFFEHQRWCFQ